MEGVARMLWNLLYNKSLMGKPAVGSSLYPEMAKEGKQCLYQGGRACWLRTCLSLLRRLLAMGQCRCLLAMGLAHG